MDTEVTDNFFITLPSNSSVDYFPQNTQSSYRTKLSSPLVLNGNWEVGLSEICIPRNWFNINEHNNFYSVTYYREESLTQKFIEHHIKLEYVAEMNIDEFCESMNNVIKKEMNGEGAVTLKVNQNHVQFEINEGYEIHIKAKGNRKMLYVLHLPIEDKVINKSISLKYRASSQFPVILNFTFVNRNPKSSSKLAIQLIIINPFKASI